MNILHMKYAVEVAAAGSINKASEKLLVAQPNLSRSIKELEADLGISIFDRSSRGMVLTPEGEEFIRHAKKIIADIDSVERMFKTDSPRQERLGISCARLSYVARVFADFEAQLDQPVRLSFRETNSQIIMADVSSEESELGIMRYASAFDRYYKAIFEEKGFASELIRERQSTVIVNEASPLAGKESVTVEELSAFKEITHSDPYIASLPMAMVRREIFPTDGARRIVVNSRATQFDLLVADPECFIWASGVPEEILRRYGLKELACSDFSKTSQDVVIWKKNTPLSPLAQSFLGMLREAGKLPAAAPKG